MATIYDVIYVAHNETSGNAQRDLIAETGHSQLAGLKLKDYFKSFTSGMRPAVVQTKVNAAKASGTITLATLANGHVITIGGIAFTAKTSGAAGAFEFNIGSTDTEAAANYAIVANAATATNIMVIVSSATTVITVEALVPGAIGNAVGTVISGGGSAAAARLTAGTNGDVERTHYYGSGA